MVKPVVSRLRGKTRTVEVKIVDPDTKEEDLWVLRAISAMEFLEHEEIFDKLPTKVPKEGDTYSASEMKNTLLPMLKAFLPMGCVSPRVTLDQNDPELKNPESDLLHLSHFSISYAAEILSQILKISGFSKEAEADRKNLPATAL